jgi:hypothetical protein
VKRNAFLSWKKAKAKGEKCLLKEDKKNPNEAEPYTVRKDFEISLFVTIGAKH